MLKPLISGNDIKSAFESLQRTMEQGSRRVNTILGWKGENHKFTVYWHPDLGIWNYFDPRFAETRYWCPYGINDPNKLPMVPITAEINFVYKGYNRRLAGIFLRDEHRNTYLGHTGKIGGGRKGIGKSAFWNFYRGDQTIPIQCPDGKIDYVICIGRLGSRELPSQIAHFVREVARFKNSISSNGKVEGSSVPLDQQVFTPEFEGQRKPYRINRQIDSQCNHGRIAAALASELACRGYDVANDRSRDLYVLSPPRQILILFEIKTDLETTSLYTSLGQLMFHGALQQPPPKRILVVPGQPTSMTQKVLRRIGIRLVTYRLCGAQIHFSNLQDAIEQIP